MTITQAQFSTAEDLARAYGHHWANAEYSLGSGFTTEGGIEPAAIRSAVIAVTPEGTIGGIYAPDLNAAGEVEHRTGSGRLGWRVALDGGVVLSVYRSLSDDRSEGEIEVLRATVGAWYSTPNLRSVRVEVLAGSVCYARHLTALRVALAALLGAQVAWGAVLPYAAELAITVALCQDPHLPNLWWELVDEGVDRDPELGPCLMLPSGFRTTQEAFNCLASRGAT